MMHRHVPMSLPPLSRVETPRKQEEAATRRAMQRIEAVAVGAESDFVPWGAQYEHSSPGSGARHLGSALGTEPQADGGLHG